MRFRIVYWPAMAVLHPIIIAKAIGLQLYIDVLDLYDAILGVFER